MVTSFTNEETYSWVTMVASPVSHKGKRWNFWPRTNKRKG